MFGTFPTIPMGFGGFGIDSVTNRSFCHRELTETPFQVISQSPFHIVSSLVKTDCFRMVLWTCPKFGKTLHLLLYFFQDC